MPCVVILTALSIEFLAVCNRVTDLQQEMHPQGMVYQKGKFVAEEQTWEVGIVEVGTGNVEAALETERAIAHFNPDILFFVGIAGGIKDVSVGDVVVATKVYYYESGKQSEHVLTRPEMGQSAYALVQRAKREAEKLDWQQRVSKIPVLPPQVHVAPIAAGEKVIATKDSETFRLLKSHYNDAIAVEMEGFGFLKAAFAHPDIKAIVIRSISDLIDGKNDDEIEPETERQAKAADHASAFAFEILAKHQSKNRNLKITRDWMWRNLEVVIANAGARYTPEIHVDLPEAWIFEGLGRTNVFFDRIQNLYSLLCRRGNKALSCNTLQERFPAVVQSVENLHQPITELISIFRQIENTNLSLIPFSEIAVLANQTEAAGYNCYEVLREVESSLNIQRAEGQKTRPSSQSDKEVLGSFRHNVSQLLDVIRKIIEFSASESSDAANRKAVLLLGEAGAGKTHLFCDVAKHRLEKGLPTIIFLGQHFNQNELWTQILQQMQLPISSRDEFLTELNMIAQDCGDRALILIDALNERDRKDRWKDELPGFLKVLENYPYIGVAVSCRTSYEQIVISDDLIPEKIVKVQHRGFEDQEYTATKTFFDYYGIERPNIPLLVPEFSNPLFLKIFCQGLKKRQFTRIPKGLKGITAVFNFFVDAVHEMLCHRLDYDPAINLVQQAVNLLAQAMAETGKPWIERSQASSIMSTLLPGKSYQQSLFANLLSEGLLNEDLIYLPLTSGEKELRRIDVVKFPYERFSDHLIARYLLNTHLDEKKAASSFASNQPLGTLLAEEWQTWSHIGWIEALCIQVPERLGKELVELVPWTKTWEVPRRGFLQSLIWRAPMNIAEGAKGYLKEIYVEEDGHTKVYEVLLTISSEPEHPFNAKFLHQHLMGLNMPDRDQVWSIYLADHYEQRGAVDRLLDWAWNAEKSHIADEAIELCTITLAWFLTTSHRYVRDRATKVLVSMLHQRPRILIEVLARFLDVNDLYVAERLYAIAYGVAMISDDTESVGELSGKVYGWVFADSKPPTHILLRSYARGVIETAQHRGILPLNVETERVRPPYQTQWLTNIPSKEELQFYGETSDNMNDCEWSRHSIYESVMGFGDFARYIIGTNLGHFSWSSCRLGETGKAETLAIRKHKTDDFHQILTGHQKNAWENYKTIHSNINWWKHQSADKQIEQFGQAFSEEEWDELFTYREGRFLKTLGKKKQQLFREYVLPHLIDPQGNEFNFDLSLAQCWILKRVFDLGWTIKKFGSFDRRINQYSYGREANKPERIGKKYQWIGYHEFLAYVADNFEFIQDGFDEDTNHYDGPWQVSDQLRDIDLSLLLRRSPDTDDERTEGLTTWWQPIQYIFAEADRKEQIAWITQKDDCPNPHQWIECTHSNDHSTWLTLEGHYRWTERGPIEEDPYEGLRRSMWFQVRSYIIRQEDSEELLAWLQEKNFMGRWMPESVGMYEVFVGEFPWADACALYNDQENVWGRWGDRLPVPLVVTTTNYIRESSSQDCSIDETISALMPAAWLIQKMNLRWSGGNFKFVNASNKIIAFDPSTEQTGPQALLISKKEMEQFLTENKLMLIWTVLGERELVGGQTQEWRGRLEISGVYSLQTSSVIDGSLKVWHKSPL
jgi:nucleoside phosphorylase